MHDDGKTALFLNLLVGSHARLVSKPRLTQPRLRCRLLPRHLGSANGLFYSLPLRLKCTRCLSPNKPSSPGAHGTMPSLHDDHHIDHHRTAAIDRYPFDKESWHQQDSGDTRSTFEHISRRPQTTTDCCCRHLCTHLAGCLCSAQVREPNWPPPPLPSVNLNSFLNHARGETQFASAKCNQHYNIRFLD